MQLSDRWNITLKSISLFSLVLVAWITGAVELVDTLTHFDTQWPWYILATVYTVMLNELFSHRICSHSLFEIGTNRITYKILTFLLTVDNAWCPLTDVCRTHQGHHIYTDKGEIDNLDWSRNWYSFCSLSPLVFVYQHPKVYPNAEKFFTAQRKRFKNIIDDTWTFFCEDNRVLLTVLFWLILYVILPVVLFKIVLMGRFLASIQMVLATYCSHHKMPFSYRNFSTHDNSQNNLILHYICLGFLSSLLHNNHHGRQATENHAVRWFEIDTGYYLIRLIKPLITKT